MRINQNLNFSRVVKRMEEMKEFLKKMKEFLRSEFERSANEFEKKSPGRDRRGGETPLHRAAYVGHTQATILLLENGADVNAVDEWKQTALHLAANKGHVDVTNVLIQNGADREARVEHFCNFLERFSESRS